MADLETSHATLDHTGITGAGSPQALDTTDSPQFAGVNLGHASDTTLTRVSAGVVAIEGTNIVKAGAASSSGITMATARLLGRTTASTGAIEEITVGTGLSLSAGSLTATGGGTSTFHGARVYLGAAQSIADNTMTAVLWDTEDYDTDTFHDTSSNKSRMTVGTTGYYRISGGGLYAASGSGTQRYAELKKNGTTVVAKTNWFFSASTGTYGLIETTCALSATDYVELNVYQDTGGALNFGGTVTGNAHMTITLLGS